MVCIVDVIDGHNKQHTQLKNKEESTQDNEDVENFNLCNKNGRLSPARAVTVQDIDKTFCMYVANPCIPRALRCKSQSTLKKEKDMTDLDNRGAYSYVPYIATIWLIISR